MIEFIKKILKKFKKITYSTNPKEVFSKELDLIKNQEIKDLVIKVLMACPICFWELPASTSGKYHPAYCLGKGGLVRHVKAAVKIAKDLLELEMYSDLDSDLIISALILHDSVKAGINVPYIDKAKTVFEHPLLAAILVEECYDGCNLDKSVVYNIERLIASHMGQWNTSYYSTTILPKPIKKDEQFVHLCDYLASRKHISIEL